MGQYRSNPCRHPLRMVSVLWQGVWYRYLTNVLDPQVLSARQVCELYRRRWRIEDAFALTKRVLDLAYLWTGSTNAVQLQIYATLIFYAVLLTICQQVAQALGEPLERISVEMVFRAFYHYSRAVERGEYVTISCRFWLSMPNSWALSSGGASITASASNWSPSFGETLKLRPVGPAGASPSLRGGHDEDLAARGGGAVLP